METNFLFINKIFVVVLILFHRFATVYNFNFDTKFPIIYENPGDPGNLFGYSVILYEGSSTTAPWIQMGAPKYYDNSSSRLTGHVYRCGIKERCKLLDANINVEVSDAALGNSMDISSDGSTFAVCGHKYILKGGDDYYSLGFCHVGATNETDTAQRVPFGDQQRFLKRSNNQIYNFGQGQMGFSLQFTKYQEAIIGAPGVYNWAGSAILMGEGSGGSTAARRLKRSTANWNNFRIPQNSAGSNAFNIYDLSLLGFSVTSGSFTDKNKIQYVAGAPRHNMIGAVKIFNYNEDDKIEEIEFKEGLQYGEYFGGSLASADLNNDGYSDLIIGAPTYKKSKYNEGRIYIYYGSYGGLNNDKVIIEGKQENGQFGDSIASLGDIDFDGYEDIAVAATYEDEGSGTVYIYRGSEGILGNQPQEIRGKDYNIRGFGHSIGKPRDIDGNHYNDLSIGAYKSEHAIIFRARPVIILEHYIKEEDIEVTTESTTFNFTSCVKYTTKRKWEKYDLIVLPKFIIDESHQRATLINSRDEIQLNAPDNEECTVYNVQLKPGIKNIYDPIVYSFSLEVKENKFTQSNIIVNNIGNVAGEDNFCKFCPVLDPKKETKWEGRLARFNLGCNGGNVCYSQLHTTTSFKDMESPNVFVIGSKQYITLVTEVQNDGDKAYLTELKITLPSDPKVTLRSVPPICQENNVTFITCFIANPLNQNEKKTLELELDMEKVNEGSNKILDFNIAVSTSSNNTINSNRIVQLSTVKKADIKIRGHSKEEYYSFDNTSSIVEFAQVFQIQKEGPSSIKDVLIELRVPVSYKASNGKFLEFYKPTSAQKGQLINCRGVDFVENSKPSGFSNTDVNEVNRRRRRRSAEDVTKKFQQFTGFYVNCSDTISELKCENVYCNIGKMSKDVVEVQFKFRMNIENIPKDVFGESDVIVIGNNYAATIKDEDLNDNTSTQSTILSTVLVGPNVEKKVPIWIIIVAVLCGVLVLAIIAAVLYKLGFFKRAQKEKLEEEMKAENEATEAINLNDNDEE